MATARQIARARAHTAAQFLGDAKITITRINPDDVTYSGGRLVAAPGEVIYSGAASISDAAARDAVTRYVGGQAVQVATWLIRAPIAAQAAQAGDLIHVDDPGDFPIAHQDLWVHGLKGRQVAVLARILATATRPGDV